jgi:hypothetical protein
MKKNLFIRNGGFGLSSCLLLLERLHLATTKKPTQIQNRLRQLEKPAGAATTDATGQTTDVGTAETTGQKNAVSTAKSYLNYTAFSYEGLIGQLEYENILMRTRFTELTIVELIGMNRH